MKSIVQIDGTYCFICREAIGTETHHIFGAANRKWSDADGLTIRVCRSCHEKIHFSDISGDLQRALHVLGQTQWEVYFGPKLEAAGKDPREEFMKRYGRNWL